jgi:hypothetical protein
MLIISDMKGNYLQCVRTTHRGRASCVTNNDALRIIKKRRKYFKGVELNRTE